MKNNSNPSQARAILNYMRENGSITPLEAMNELGCMRLGSRIFELRQDGYDIRTEKVSRINALGKKSTFARYRLEKVNG